MSRSTSVPVSSLPVSSAPTQSSTIQVVPSSTAQAAPVSSAPTQSSTTQAASSSTAQTASVQVTSAQESLNSALRSAASLPLGLAPSQTSPVLFDSVDAAVASAAATTPESEHYDGTPPAQIVKSSMPSSIPILFPDVRRERSWKSLLDLGDLVIGENHQDISPKRFLIENMSFFKSKGVEILFMEHLTQADHQHLMDFYFKDSEKEMPQTLREYLDEMTCGHMDKSEDLEYLDEVYKYNFRTIVEEAKKCGIKVVCLETKLDDYKLRFTKGVDRTRHFNSAAASIIKKEIGGEIPKRWIAFMGNTHLNTYYHGNAGVCELVPNTQDLFIFDAKPEEKSSLRITSTKERLTRGQSGEYIFIASMVLTQKSGFSMAYNPELTLPSASKIASGGAASSHPLSSDAASASAAGVSHIVDGTKLSLLPNPEGQTPFRSPIKSPLPQRRSSIGAMQLPIDTSTSSARFIKSPQSMATAVTMPAIEGAFTSSASATNPSAPRGLGVTISRFQLGDEEEDKAASDLSDRGAPSATLLSGKRRRSSEPVAGEVKQDRTS
jgi:hypothetical protein